jgi:glycosyltransferase involved in cell wall biosynthesis
LNTRSSVIFTSWPLHTGVGSGVARVASGLRRALGRRGWECELVSPSFSGDGYVSTTVRRIFFNYRLRSDHRIRLRKPVITFDFDGFLFPPGVRFAQINGGILPDIIRFEKGLIKQAVRFMAVLEKLASKKADRIFVPSQYAREKLCALYNVPDEKVSVMHNGIFFNEWSDRVSAAPPVPDRPPTVLSVSRFYRRKGLDLLLKSWPRVLAELPDARLCLVGDGLERENLKRLAQSLRVEDSIEWTGTVLSDDVIAAHYANCDLFCLPSRHESFGLVFLEAMAAGKPVVALKTTAVPEVVRDGVDGILAEPEDVKSVAAGIITLPKNRELRMTMGREGRERVRKNFDFANVITPLVEWMEERNAE